jgi:hypothetical protein
MFFCEPSVYYLHEIFSCTVHISFDLMTYSATYCHFLLALDLWNAMYVDPSYMYVMLQAQHTHGGIFQKSNLQNISYILHIHTHTHSEMELIKLKRHMLSWNILKHLMYACFSELSDQFKLITRYIPISYNTPVIIQQQVYINIIK